MNYQVELRFNGRLTGAGQIWTGQIEADSPVFALEHAVGFAVRDARHGHSIFVTGATIDEVKR